MPLPKAKREETYGAFFSFKKKLWYRNFQPFRAPDLRPHLERLAS